MKKFIALFLVLSFFNFSFLPVYASSKTKVETVIISNINANKTQNDEIVKFVSTQDIKNYDGNIIPQGTVFTGKINSIEKSRGAYKRAKISINIYEMTLPNGEHYNIKASTKNKFLKGSAFGNIAKGFCTTPIALSVGCLGSIAILFECISVVGLIAVVPTGNFFGRAMGKITKGLNCKKHKGDVIAILVDNANFTTDNNIYINNKTNHNEQNTSY
ncbi:hypothetical protein IJG14_06135, partial [bacterium]|nr:hypothetical protein [bacterium]